MTHPEQIDPLRRIALQLIVASFIVLFQELALIRWFGALVRVTAYFPNVVLIASFLGLGIGSLRSKQKSLLWLWPICLLALVLCAIGLGRIAFTQESTSEHLWLLYLNIPNAQVVNGIRLPILLAFTLTAATFVPLGQFVAQRLQLFRERSSALWGYSFDLTGSLVGVLAFAIASFARQFPVVWFSAIAAAGIYLIWPTRARAVGVICLAAIVLLVAKSESAIAYSPYYAVSTQQPDAQSGVMVLTNGSYHQHARPVQKHDVIPDELGQRIRTGFHTPYRLLKTPPKKVLVLGAGTGNDVAVALDEGAEHVDAVEIDPVILELGRSIHPDHPYSSPRVHAINSDARHVLNRTTEKYDLIVFGTLDSMTRLSALSSVRLDNFVYTRECLEAAQRCLTSDGGIIMYFSVTADFIHQRLFKMVYEAIGTPPLVEKHDFYLFNVVYAAGPAFVHRAEALSADDRARLDEVVGAIQSPTDDWPYLYLAKRGVSWFYLSLILSIVAISVAGIGLAAPQLFRGALRGPTAFDAEMFFFGVGFLLLETKSVTEMNLVWGVTWVTSAVVFGAILLVLLLSTLWMQYRPMPIWLCVTGLAVTLLASWAIPTRLLIGQSTIASLLLSIAFVGLPIFFASTCFTARFRERPTPDFAFGWNLIGAVAGGLLEFSSMATGFRTLALVAFAAYFIGLFSGRKVVRASQPVLAGA